MWDTLPSSAAARGLGQSVALFDPAANRTLMVGVAKDLTITTSSLPLSHGFVTAAPTPDGTRLLVLCRGDVPIKKASDRAASLQLIADGVGASAPTVARTYTLKDPLSNLAVDPEGTYAIVSAAASDAAFVQNPNELSLVDLTQPFVSADHGASANPLPITLRSFGGTPKSFVFTPMMQTPGGPRRLLVALTDRDIGIIDLNSPALQNITVQLSSTGQVVAPAAIAVSPGSTDGVTNARIAIREANDPSIIIVDLVASTGTEVHDFHPSPNVALASGVPSDISFVSTDDGLRLAALVPGKQVITLIDPLTGATSDVALGAPYEHISIVTEDVGATLKGGDVALLWSDASPDVAFVALGSTIGKPYKSVQPLALGQPVRSVIDVPRSDTGSNPLKILAATDGRTFYVLDLVARTASPILATSGTTLTAAPTGNRAWLYNSGSYQLASLDLSITSLYPTNLNLSVIDSRLDNAFDIATASGGRALVAVDDTGDVGLTILDAEKPDLTAAVTYRSILLGGVQ